MPDAAISKAEKHAINRAKLSEAAQSVLLRQGYARSSLRDIAAEAGVSLGRLHYYFNDKSHLMISAFRDLQARFIQNIHDVAAADREVAGRCRRMAAIWSRQMIESGRTYRIWYDLRNQALFDPELRPVVTEMEALQVAALVALVEAEDAPAQFIEQIRVQYVPLLGGLFHHALQRMTFGETIDAELLEQSLASVLFQLLAQIKSRPEVQARIA